MTENKILLSVLIPTVVGREKEFNELYSTVLKQVDTVCNADNFIQSFIVNELGLHGGKHDNLIEVIYCIDDKSITIGEKRETLYKYASGLYSWQIDDDDSIAPNAIQIILEAIKNNPDVDCITFREKCMINGEYKASNFSHRYSGWHDDADGFAWVRDVFYKCVIKTSIAKSVPFHRVRFGEDELFSKDIKHLIHTEYNIDEELYYYIHNSTPHHERYGFDKDK